MKKLKFSKKELAILIPIINKRLKESRHDDFIKNSKKLQNRFIWLETFVDEIKSGEAYVRPITRAEIQGIVQEHLLTPTNIIRNQFINFGYKEDDLEEVQRIDLFNEIFNRVVKRGIKKRRMVFQNSLLDAE